MCDRQITARRCCHNAPSGCTYALPGVCDFGATALALPLGGWQCGHQSRSDRKASRDETPKAGPQTQATRGSLFRAFVMTQPMQPQGEHLSCRAGNRATGAGRPEEPLGPDGSRLRCKPARCADHRRATLPGKRPPHPGCNSASRGLDCLRLRSWSCRLRGPGLCERGPGDQSQPGLRTPCRAPQRRASHHGCCGANEASPMSYDLAVASARTPGTANSTETGEREKPHGRRGWRWRGCEGPVATGATPRLRCFALHGYPSRNDRRTRPSPRGGHF